jgi:hypothetical protein
VRKLVADGVCDAFDRERRAYNRRVMAAAGWTWTDRDDQAVDDYSREPE